MQQQYPEQHETCNCHECTQARWKISLQYQIDSALAPRGNTSIDGVKDGIPYTEGIPPAIISVNN